VRLVGEGFKDNEIVALRKINANRAALVVEQLALIRKHLALVEREMQKAAAQKDMLAAARWETAQPCTARWSFCVNYLGRGTRPYDWSNWDRARC
jgi:hypothetical protein